MYKGKDRIQVYVGWNVRVYDVKNNKFVNTPAAPVLDYASLINQVNNAKTPEELTNILTGASRANNEGTLSADDLMKINEAANAKRAALDNETPDVSGVTPSASGAVGFDNTSDDKEVKTAPKGVVHIGKSLVEIEAEMKEKKVVGRQTQDAWNAIPNDLKLKLVNEGATLKLASFTENDRIIRNKVITISMSDRQGLIKALKDVNMSAKAGHLKVTEAAKPMEKDGIVLSREKEQAARRWLAKNLPSLSSEERTQFVDKLARMGDDAGKAWGSYRSGVIQIQRNAPMGTVYHEAFHYVMDMIMSPEEQKEILDIAMKEYGVNDAWTAEERLANDFRRYAMDENAEGIVGKIRRIIRKIMDRITRYNRISDTTVNQLFWKINNGELAEKSNRIESFEETQQEVLREIRNVQAEKMYWDNLLSDTKAAFKDSGVSKETYNSLSLEEKEQYVRCRG